MVREEFKKLVYVLNPQDPKKRSMQLNRNSDRHRDVRRGNLIAAQFTNPIKDSVGEFHKPPSWN